MADRPTDDTSGDALPEAILRFWFGPPEGDPFQNQSMWWKKDEALDQTIRDRFGAAIEAAGRGELDGWADAARSRLALIILLDQFTRNVHRGTPGAFANDAKALDLTLDGIERGIDRELRPVERYFFYMPLMHVEDHALQQKGVATFARLADEAPPEQRKPLETAVDFAERHRVIIERFGRFPHRNAILGRETTPEEAEFLTQPGSSF